ncbi:Glyoxylate carboligase, partial [human gut metagenome]
QRAFDMDYCVQLAFENINSSEVNGYGVDHVKVAEGLGCKAIRVFKPEDIPPAGTPALARRRGQRGARNHGGSGGPGGGAARR